VTFNTVNYAACVSGSETIVDKYDLLNWISISFDGLAHSLDRRSTIQELIYEFDDWRRLVFDHLGGSWVNMHFFALLEVGKSRIRH